MVGGDCGLPRLSGLGMKSCVVVLMFVGLIFCVVAGIRSELRFLRRSCIRVSKLTSRFWLV